MIWQRARFALLASVVLASAAVSARAENLTPVAAGGGSVASAPVGNPCAPATQSIRVTEWVAQNFTSTVTVYKTVCTPETFTAYKTVCVPQTCTRVCTVNKMVPVVQNVVRTVCVPTPCVETRTVMKTVVTCKPVTTVTRKCVDMGHYVCKQVPCRQGCLAKMRAKHNCCCECCCVPMKTVRMWCPNKVWVETPCTKMVRCCQCVPCTTQVTVCKMVPKQITCQVCCYKCVPQQVTQCYTTMVSKCVPFQCTRMVAKCVPCQQTVTCCRMVPHTVVKQVACGNTCGNTCCTPCCNTCCTPCCKKCRRSHRCCR
ncbi:MAG: hypothetical protein ACRELG_13250 [Gemmataceae bacterium]